MLFHYFLYGVKGKEQLQASCYKTRVPFVLFVQLDGVFEVTPFLSFQKFLNF
jgi:hypothetical protein